MKALSLMTFGGPEVLEVGEVDAPEPGPGQVRVSVAAATVNPIDVAVRSGRMGPMVPLGPRYVLGWDVAGTIDAVGDGVTEWRVGDHVVGIAELRNGRWGTHAELVVLDEGAVAPHPVGLSSAQAAVLPANALTAWQSLDLLDVAPGGSVLVTGAAGAVGGYVVELARHRGLRVLGLAGEADAEFLRERGAEFVSREGDVVAAVRALVPGGVDGVIDGAVLSGAVMGAVRDGGAFVSLIPPATPESERGIRVERGSVRADAGQLRAIVGLAEAGVLTPRVAYEVGFDEAARAHRDVERGGLRGRPVLRPSPR